MKTNRRKPFILATLALGLVLVMGLGANTFAKYYTKVTSDDHTARVAKWGVKAVISPTGLFGTKYTDNVIDDDATTKLEVSAAADVVAPGTSGSATINFTGAPEVACEIVVTIKITDNVVIAAGTEVAGEELADEYRPIQWNVANATTWTAGGDNAVYAANVRTMTFTKQFAPGSIVLADPITLSWEWAFGAASANDTYLGDRGTDTVEVDISVEFSQLDTSLLPAA